MRILHVDHSPVFGGAERSVLELAASQLRLGDEAIVAVGQPGAFSAALDEAGVPWTNLDLPDAFVHLPATARVTALGASVPAFAVAAVRLRRAASRVRPDVIHVHTRKAHLLASVAFLFSTTPTIWHLRDDVPSRRFARLVLRAGLRRAGHAVALSDWLASHYRACGLRPRSGRIGIVPSGIDGRALGTLPTPWLDGKRGPVVGYVGQIAAWKGPDLVVEAFERLHGPPDRQLTIAGDLWFPAAESGYETELEARIAASPERDRIHRLRGVGPVDAFASIDILVHSSIRPEPFGRVIVEALAARRPVVAFPQGAAPEILAEGIGVLAARVDSAALSQALATVLADRQAAARMAQAGVARAAEFAPDVVAERMAIEYEALR